MKTLLTRIGYNSKFLINGDLEQVDTRNKVNGLQHAMDRLTDMPEIGIIKFDKDDIVRNPLIGKILDRY
jgi:phosphate starvation-inducible PhoH-like protein